MVSSRRKILFVHNAATTFVRVDHLILAEEWNVVEWHQRTRWFNVPRLWRAVSSVDLVFCWFAGWHSFLPVMIAKMMGTPVITVVGGYDTARVPEADYGSMRGGLVRQVTRAVIRYSDALVAFSHFSGTEAVVNGGSRADKIKVVYLGIPGRTPGAWSGRNPIAITVGGVWRENFHRKGLLPFVRTSVLLPEFEFVLVGKWNDDSIQEIRKEAGPNVKFSGLVSDEELDGYYKSASVYVQPSLHEGFGMSVAESMLAGCIPVVTRNGSLPEVVGEAGIYLDSIEPQAIADGIRKAHRMGEQARRAARQRILDQFSLDRRRSALKQVVRDTLK